MPCENTAKEKSIHRRFEQAQHGDKEARDKLVEENTGLIYMVLKRFQNRGCEMEDLFQIGAIGLIKAVEHFDTTRELAFSTYAVPVIIGEIQRFLRDDGMIHISRSLKLCAGKVAAVREKYLKNMNREPTIFELEEATGCSQEEILTALEANQSVRSLESVYEEEERPLFEQIASPEKGQDAFIDRLAVEQLLLGLEEKERQLIRLRYWEGRTQSEVAAILMTNQVAVSRAEKKILLQLRKKFEYNRQRK